MNICIVDDSSFQRNQLKKMIESIGHEVYVAKTADEVLLVVQTHSFDCIITDLLMPDKDGKQLTRELKQLKPTLPVIVLTADIQTAVREECLAVGANGFLNKPASPEKISEALRALPVEDAA